MPATSSGACRTSITVHAGPPFRLMPAGDAIRVDHHYRRVFFQQEGELQRGKRGYPAEATFSQGAGDWLGTHVRALSYFGGVPRLALQLAALRKQREEVAKEVERLVVAHPLYPVLTSMPGVGVRTAARLLVDVATRAFASAGHLAAYAGLAPVTRRSGSSISGKLPSIRENKLLMRVMFLSAFAAPREPISRAYYTRKISQGKRHNQALTALARRRCDVLVAMLRDGTRYSPPRPESLLTTT